MLVRVGDDAGGWAPCTTFGVVFRNDLKPTCGRGAVPVSLALSSRSHTTTKTCMQAHACRNAVCVRSGKRRAGHCATTREKKRIIGRKNRCDAHLRDDLADFTEVGAATEPRAGEEVLDEARADVVAHLVELLVDLGVVLVVLHELDDERAVREREELCVLSLSTSGSSIGGGTGGREGPVRGACGTYDLLGAALPEVLAYGLVLLACRRHPESIVEKRGAALAYAGRRAESVYDGEASLACGKEMKRILARCSSPALFSSA